ncbi:MAG: DNRLRE domain-containing protein [Phycisphaerales bacterium]|nr:DNRLRE domain-containing protein [Phycisphaerales bacterium]
MKMSMFGSTAALAAGVVAVVSSAASAQTASIVASRDNTIYQTTAGATSNGAGDGIFSGRNRGGTIRRGLVYFDLSVIPAGATITGATLQLSISQGQGTATASFHRALSNWGEGTSSGSGQGAAATPGDATWLFSFFNTTPWATPGGDFVPTPSATGGTANGIFVQWSSAGLLSDVQGWYSGALSNFGWFIIGDESGNQTADRWGSREIGGGPEFAPTLFVNYVIPTPSAGVGLAMLGLTLARRRR